MNLCAANPDAAGSDRGLQIDQHQQSRSYHNIPMTRAYVDGRLFIRGMEAIYCYDLRAEAK